MMKTSICRNARACFAVLGAVVSFTACGTPPRAPLPPAPVEQDGAVNASGQSRCGRSVTVRRGDTLSAIARRCGVPLASLTSENDLRPPYTIYPGQELIVRGQTRTVAGDTARPSIRGRQASHRPVSTPSQASSAEAPRFQWPIRGEILDHYGSAAAGRIDGVRIAARMGQPVLAAASGEVVYADEGLQGYGKLVLIRHTDNWVTAYGFNSRLRVQEGQQVVVGQHIADAGVSGPLTRPAVHFEVRHGVNPVNPVEVLPVR